MARPRKTDYAIEELFEDLPSLDAQLAVLSTLRYLHHSREKRERRRAAIEELTGEAQADIELEAGK